MNVVFRVLFIISYLYLLYSFLPDGYTYLRSLISHLIGAFASPAGFLTHACTYAYTYINIRYTRVFRQCILD